MTALQRPTKTMIQSLFGARCASLALPTHPGCPAFPLAVGLLLVVALSPVGGCGDDGGPSGGDDDDDDDMMVLDAGRNDAGPEDAGPDDGIPCGEPFQPPEGEGIPRGYEGQTAWVVSLDARPAPADGPEQNYSCATVERMALTGPNILAQKCNAARCGVVLDVPDLEPNGTLPPWPTLVGTRAFFLEVVSSVAPISAQAPTSYAFLPEFEDSSGTDTLQAGPVRVVSSITSPDGVRFRVIDDFPLRIFSMSGGTFGADVVVSADGSDGLAGGFDGGFELSEGFGPGGGGAGDFENAGGGGGFKNDGETNSSGGSTGGMAYAGPFGSCIPNALSAVCGGSGGGGQAGPGGGGGGAFSIVGLGPLNLSGAEFLALGGQPDTGSGGGGGAGGAVFVAAPEWQPPDAIDVSFGFGGINETLGQRGGAGSVGLVRVDVPGETWEDSLPGVAVDLPFEPADYLVEDPNVTLTGFAEPGSAVCATDLFLVEAREVPIAQAMTCARQLTGPDGSWTLELRLRPGINRLQIQSGSDTGVANSWTGNSFRFERFDLGDNEVFAPVAGLLDFVYVPDSEPIP